MVIQTREIQTMVDLICLLRFRIASPKISIDRGAAEVRNSWGGDPESHGANRSAYCPRDQSLFVEYYHILAESYDFMNSHPH